MTDANYFDDILANVRKQVEKNGDLTEALEDNFSDLFHGIVDQPLDCGVRRFRSITLSRQSNVEGTGERMRNAWLLSVRGIDDSGADVITFCGAETWLECIIDFAYRGATQSVEWKPDRKQSDRSKRVSFFDTLQTDDNGNDGNGANVRGRRSGEKGGLGGVTKKPII